MAEPTIVAIVAFIVIALAAGAGGYLAAHIHHLFKSHEARLKDLEDAVSKTKHTLGSKSAIEDALAVTIDLLMEENANQAYRKARMDQLHKILKIHREGPLAYDPDREAGGRPGRV